MPLPDLNPIRLLWDGTDTAFQSRNPLKTNLTNPQTTSFEGRF